MELTTIAEASPTGPLRTFGPYVPSVDAEGRVAFQATRTDGSTAVFVGDGVGPARALEVDGPYAQHEVVSHPATSPRGIVWFARKGAHEAVLAHDGARVEAVIGNDYPGLDAIGPLGPTTDDDGAIAFRGTAQGHPVVGTARGGLIELFDDKTLTRHAGLPIVRGERVLVRADDVRGRNVVVEVRGKEQRVLLATGRTYASLGAFVSADGERIAANVRRVDGQEALVEIADGTHHSHVLLEAGADFTSLRGVLVAGPHTVFYATPHDGELAVYALGREPHRLVGLGDRWKSGPRVVPARDSFAARSRAELFGPRISDLALNPVSIHRAGWLAIRLALEDGQERIVRASLRDLPQ